MIDALNPAGSADTTLATYTQGLLTQLRDPRGVLRSWRYDLRGLMTAEVDEASAVDSARYDPAGLVMVHRTRYIASVTNSYDALDRLTKTVIPGRTLSYLGQNANVPADSVLRSYDVMGNVVSESNRNATITRTWFATGHLRSERVVPVSGRALADSVWYAYDNGGRLRRVSWQTGDSVVYRYNAAGDLDTMRVHIWRSSGGNLLERWRFVWDGLGRRRTVHYPNNGMTASYAYDRLGTLRRIQSTNPGSGASVDRFDFTFRQDSVDVLGRPLHQSVQCHFTFAGSDPAIPCRDWLPSETSNRYNRLGALAVQTRVGTGPARDTLRYDRSGNLIQRREALGGQVTDLVYPASSNRLSYQRDSLFGSPGHTDRNFSYDAAGNRLRSARSGSDTLYWQ